MIGLASAGQDTGPYAEVGLQCPTFAYGVTPPPPEPGTLWSSNATTVKLELYATVTEGEGARDLFKATLRVREFVPELALIRAKISSRYTTGSWASVNAGYGQYFPGDRIGRVRMNGAGLENPGWVFLKMNLTF